MRPAPPAAAVGERPGPGGHAPRLHGRALPGAAGRGPGGHPRPGGDHRHHRRASPARPRTTSSRPWRWWPRPATTAPTPSSSRPDPAPGRRRWRTVRARRGDRRAVRAAAGRWSSARRWPATRRGSAGSRRCWWRGRAGGDPSMLTGRTGQGKLVHFAPPDARRRRLPGVVRRRDGHRGGPAPPGGRAASGDRPAPPPGASRCRRLTLGPGAGRRAGTGWWPWSVPRPRASRRWPLAVARRRAVTSSSSRSTRCASTGAWTSARPSRRPAAGRRSPTTWSIWSTPPRSSPCAEFQAAARARPGGIAARGRRPCWWGGPGCTCAPWSTTSTSRVAGRRWPPALEARGRRPTAASAGLHARLAAPRPGGGRTDRAGQPPPGGPGPRGDAGVGPAVLLVRSRARRLPADRR